MRGRVKFFNVLKGYGFISGDDGNDYYLNSRQIVDMFFTPYKGDRVEFNVRDGLGDKNVAINVRKVKSR
jgi:CspA family cold shock protein